MAVDTAIWRHQLTAGERAELARSGGELPEQRPDVLVVGGGILGAATAAAGHEAGLGTVLLIEAGHLGSGATGGAAGLLTPEIHEWSDPAPFVDLARASPARGGRLQKTGARRGPRACSPRRSMGGAIPRHSWPWRGRAWPGGASNKRRGQEGSAWFT